MSLPVAGVSVPAAAPAADADAAPAAAAAAGCWFQLQFTEVVSGTRMLVKFNCTVSKVCVTS